MPKVLIYFFCLFAYSVALSADANKIVYTASSIPGQKHRGEGFMEGFRVPSEDKNTSTQTQVGDIIPTEDGKYQATKSVTLNIDDIRFAFDSYDIASVFELQIQQFATDLSHNPHARALLEGHTDWIGTELYNMNLSFNRANAVKDKMLEFGIDENRITIKAYGKSRPIADNKTAEGRAKNRRVEMIFIEPVSLNTER